MAVTQPAQTSVPDWMMTYARQLADVHHHRKLNKMYFEMLEGFLLYKPYKAKPAFPWYVPKMHAYRAGTIRPSSDVGWVPMNMVLPVPLIEKIKKEMEFINLSQMDEKKLSLRTFLYTAAVWWCSVIYPYKGLKVLD